MSNVEASSHWPDCCGCQAVFECLASFYHAVYCSKLREVCLSCTLELTCLWCLYCSWSRIWRRCSYWAWTESSSIRPAAVLRHSTYWTTTHTKVEYDGGGIRFACMSVTAQLQQGYCYLSNHYTHFPFHCHCLNSHPFPRMTSFLLPFWEELQDVYGRAVICQVKVKFNWTTTSTKLFMPVAAVGFFISWNLSLVVKSLRLMSTCQPGWCNHIQCPEISCT